MQNQIDELNDNVQKNKENVNRIDNSNSFFKKTYQIIRESPNKN